MIHDTWAVMWKEWKEILAGSARNRLGPLVLVAFLGIFLPFQVGEELVSSPMSLMLWAWMPLVLVNVTVADAFAGERERHTLETILASRLSDRAILFGKVLASMAYGCGMIWASMAVALVTLNILHGHGRLLLYSPTVGLGGVGVSFLTSGMAAAGGVLISLRAASVRQAQQALGRTAVILLFVPILGEKVLPSEWKTQLVARLATVDVAWLVMAAVAVLAAIDAALLAAAMARFRRARLLLD